LTDRPFGLEGGLQDESLAGVARDVYERVALIMGRPSLPCRCKKCDCALHAYRSVCVWCRRDRHGVAPRIREE